MANAFLGNVTGTTGNAIASTVTGGATEAATPPSSYPSPAPPTLIAKA